MSDVKYPQVSVKLAGEDGNAYSILGRCSHAAKRAGLSPAQVKEFTDEATSGDYSHLIYTVTQYFTVYDDDDCEEY